MTATINDVAMGLRRLDWSKVKVEARNMDPDAWQSVALKDFPETRAVMNTDGSVTVRLRAELPNINFKGWGTWAEYKVTLDKAVISDHALLDTSSSNPLGWFAHNEWYRFTYYAVAQANTAAALASFGCNSSTCLSVNDPATQNVRALLVLAGRGLTGQTRPSSTLSHYLECENYDLDAHFEQRRMRNDRVMDVTLNAPWNDRLVIVDWITPSPTFPLAYVQ